MENGSFNIWTAYFEQAIFNIDVGHFINTAAFSEIEGQLFIYIISHKGRLVVC